jgi:hypothetical protein
MEMLKCEGYKMFNGEMEITPKNPNIKPFTLKATWLYKPDTKCWYNSLGNSYVEEICRPCVCEVIK